MFTCVHCFFSITHSGDNFSDLWVARSILARFVNIKIHRAYLKNKYKWKLFKNYNPTEVNKLITKFRCLNNNDG